MKKVASLFAFVFSLLLLAVLPLVVIFFASLYLLLTAPVIFGFSLVSSVVVGTLSHSAILVGMIMVTTSVYVYFKYNEEGKKENDRGAEDSTVIDGVNSPLRSAK